MKTSHYDSLDDYNAHVIAARRAYASDQAVAEGICGTCLENRLDRGYGRVCWRCKFEVQIDAGVA